MTKERPKKFSNSKEDWEKAITTNDPTSIDPIELEKLAKEAMKKFKSLQ